MIAFTLRLNKTQCFSLRQSLRKAEQAGDIAKAKRLMSLLLLHAGHVLADIASLLGVSKEAIRLWINAYLVRGVRGLTAGKSPGRPSKLTKNQRKELAILIEAGPEASNFPGGCWRAPMIQHLIHKKFGVFYNVRYVSELLKSMGFSYQKAAFVSDRRDAEKRAAWLSEKWREIMQLASSRSCYILFGDEASFPQWGSLSYTWAKQGVQPTVATCGSRKSFKVFGLIDYFTGRFFAKGHEGKLNSASYIEFLSGVLNKTKKHIILIQDGARYHTSKVVQAFFKKHAERITVYQLPSYSPDFNPIEKLWKKIKERGVHLKYFPTFDDLKSSVNDMLGLFDNVRKEVLSLFGFYKDLQVA
jgi:transposase